MFKTLFLDMDGVIVDFIGGVFERFGITELSNPTEWNFNYRQDFGMSSNQFWEMCDNVFWRNLDFTKEAVGIFEVLHSRDLMDRVCLLSTPSYTGFQGKVDWIKRNLPQMYYKKQFLLGFNKDWCAHPRALLIDDSYDNCQKFERAGGKSFLFPRLWNVCRDLEHQAVEELEEFFDCINLRGSKGGSK